MTKEDAEFLSSVTMGSLGAATQVDVAELREKRRSWAGVLASLQSGDYRAALEFAEVIAADGEESLRFLRWVQTWFRDLVVHRVTRDSAGIVNQDMVAQVTARSGGGEIERLLSALRQSARAETSIQRNLNRRMVLESLLLNVVGAR
jgi:DNA polymerase-3 subunit delta'